MQKVARLLQSRKFWAALIGLALVVAPALTGQELQVDGEQLAAIIAVIVSYILGTAIEDGFGKR